MTVSGSGHAEPRANPEAYAVRLGTGVPVTAGPQVRIRLAPPESLRTIGPPARARREFASTPVLLFNLLAFFATSFWGWIGDRLGRRWAMIIPSAIAVFTPRQAARRARRLPPGRRTTGLCRAHNRGVEGACPRCGNPDALHRPQFHRQNAHRNARAPNRLEYREPLHLRCVNRSCGRLLYQSMGVARPRYRRLRDQRRRSCT
jgi:hypothetical protein